ncbi:MAG: ATPase [Oscillatoriales cyanobacterium SM2_2_1]|nr:ATPase [Oscillatoriales cyanobacterium SM2_2_1]
MTPARTICLGFGVVILVGAVLLMLPFATVSGEWSDPITALFISTSAVCVTGLSVVNVGEYYSFWGQLTLLLLVQVGGLGYMTTSSMLLLLVGKRFSLREKITLQHALDTPGLQGALPLVRSIIGITLIFELSGVFLLLLVFVPQLGWTAGLWQSIFHSVSAFNNAGFSLFANSLENYRQSLLLNGTIAILIVLGGIGYQVIFEVFLWIQSRWRGGREMLLFSLSTKVAVSTTAVLLAAGMIAILLTEFNNPGTLQPLNWGDKVMAAWFQSVTARTAGFNTINNGNMTQAGLFFTIALMFVGASPGGTGGGIKTTTTRILLNCTKAGVLGIEQITLFARQIPHHLVVKATSVAVGSLLVVIASTSFLVLTEPKESFINLFFESMSAFGTVGLSTGITGRISPWGQLTIIGTMYIGRVGVLLLISALYGRQRPTLIRYPEDTLLVG